MGCRLWGHSVVSQLYGLGLGSKGQATERNWTVQGAGLGCSLRKIRVKTTLRKAQRSESESRGEGIPVGEEGLWSSNE